MAERKAYRDTRTDGIRWSSNRLGYPYVEATPAEQGDTAEGKKRAAKGSKKSAETEASDDA